VTQPRDDSGSHDGSLNIAHRGAIAGVPAASARALMRAAKRGADGVELDVQLTKDDQLIVFHDERLPNTSHLVKHLSLSDIKQHNARVFRLKDALRSLKKSDGLILLDVKVRGVVDRVVNLATEAGVRDRVVIASFDTRVLEEARRMGINGTALIVGFSRVMRELKGFVLPLFALMAPVVVARRLCASFIICSRYRATSRLLEAAHAHEMQVWVWSKRIDTALRKIPADGFITDFPEVLDVAEDASLDPADTGAV